MNDNDESESDIEANAQLRMLSGNNLSTSEETRNQQQIMNQQNNALNSRLS